MVEVKDNRFLLGLGAQKSGTTWIHNYLAGCEGADFGFAKEYHVFDALTVDACKGRREKTAKNVQTLIGQGFPAWSGCTEIKRLAFMSDPSMYFDYFTMLLSQDRIWVTGDITPSYAGLSADTLLYIRSQFEKRGVTAQSLFVARDPVDRLRSAVNHLYRNKGERLSYSREIEAMHSMQQSRGDMLRSDYEFTIRASEQAFGDKAYYEIFERLFSVETIKSLCGSCGVAYRLPEFSTPRNASEKGKEMDEGDRSTLAQKYASTIRFCRSFFGRDCIDTCWPSSRYI